MSDEAQLLVPAALPPGFDLASIPRVAVDPAESCVLCGSREWNPFADGFDYARRTCRNRWHFVACAQCDHVRLHPRPRADTLPVIDPPAVAGGEPRPQPTGRLRQWTSRKTRQAILAFCSRPPGTFFDVAAGNGHFLDLMALGGIPPSGIFAAGVPPALIDPLRLRGCQVWPQSIAECADLPGQPVDLATMFGVLERADQPVELVQRVGSVLRPGGILALETPNLDCWDATLFERHFWGGYDIPRHFHLFTSRTVVRLLNKAGFDVLGIRYQPAPAVWLASIHHSLRYGRTARPRLASLFDPRTGSRFAAALLFGFDAVRACFGAATASMLVIARKQD